jgi:uncharacterized membrane protein
MSAPDPNSFDSPLLPPKPPAAQRRAPGIYRLISTAIFGLLGCSSLSIGLVMAIALVRSLAAGEQPGRSWYVSMLTFFWTGIFWVLASWLYLHKRRPWGTTAATAGLLLPMAWEMINRLWPR